MKTLRTFYLLVVTQTLSLIGSRMTSIAVGIRVFNDTGNTAPLLLTAFFAEIPGMLGGSLGGVLVDRWDRRRVIVLADAGQAAGTLLLLLAFLSESFQLWQLYAVAFVQGAFATLQQPALDASITMLVPEQHRERANAIREMAFPLAGVVAPVLTGALFVFIGVAGVMAIDLATFLAAVGAVSLMSIPRPLQTEEGVAARGDFWQELRGGFRYLRARRVLLGLVLYFAFINFMLNGPLDLAIPYLITLTGEEALTGALLGVMSGGALAGAVLIAVWGGTRPRVHTFMPGLLLTGAMFVLFATAPSVPVLSVALFVLMVPLPLTNALFLSIMQVKTPPDMQGRVFAIVTQLLFVATPPSFLLTGFLVDNILEPAVGGAGWAAFAPLVGSAPGAGMRLLLATTGVIIFVVTAAVYALPQIRRLEATLPDYEALAE
ncbi:MAG: MFS transporter [Anaerolineae bacterium]|nr:MFS transporter [Anaerolineae bacterium]